MSLRIEDIVKEVKKELPDELSHLTEYEIERMFISQFKVLEQNIRAKSLKTVNMMYMGKFRPTSWFVKNKEKLYGSNTEDKRDINRVEELSPKQE